MSYKHPKIGIGNVVKITSNVDVSMMLNIPRTMKMGLADVLLYIEAEKN